MAVRLDEFDPKVGLVRGRPAPVELLWYATKMVFFLTAFPWPSPLKCAILRAFGAKVGRGCVIKPRVNIHLPWKLEIGDHCWVGERCEIINLAVVTLESHSALGYDVLLAAAGHDPESASMAYKNKPIRVGTGAWVASRCFVGPGVSIGKQAVVAAGTTVVKDVPEGVIVGGGTHRDIKRRKLLDRDSESR